MAIKTPSQVAAEFLTQLGALKPAIDISLTDSDWYIKGQVLGGVMAGLYSDQDSVSNDAFPQSARISALLSHLQTYFAAPNNALTPAQQAVGNIAVTGTAGVTIIPIGMQATYAPNGNVYQSVSGFTIPASSCLVPMQSIQTGQIQNLLSGAQLTVQSPPAGLLATAFASGNFALGRDQETPEQAAARILAFIQTPPEGGTVADYKRWAQEASPAVTAASVLRFINGFGTVGVVITAGTTNINTAIDTGVAVVIQPTAQLVAQVQSYINNINPITDCATVIGVSLQPVTYSASCWFAQGNINTTLPGQNFTQGQLVANSIMKAIYATPPGGRLIGSSGFLVKSDIEEQIDNDLSDEPLGIGSNPILIDRYVGNLNGSTPNLSVSGTAAVVPATGGVNSITDVPNGIVMYF